MAADFSAASISNMVPITQTLFHGSLIFFAVCAPLPLYPIAAAKPSKLGGIDEFI